MTGNRALIDYKKCYPEYCDRGICAATVACSHKVINQIDGPNEIPVVHPSLCLGCGDCIRACPLGAISIVLQ